MTVVIRTLAVGAVLGHLLFRLIVVDMSEQARATYYVAIAVFLLVFALAPTPKEN